MTTKTTKTKNSNYIQFLITIAVLWAGMVMYLTQHNEVHIQFGENVMEMSWIRFGITVSLFLLMMFGLYHFLRDSLVSPTMIRYHIILTVCAIVFFFLYKNQWMYEPRFTVEDIKANYEAYLLSKAKYGRWEALYFFFLFCSILSFMTNIVLSLFKFMSKTLWKKPMF